MKFKFKNLLFLLIFSFNNEILLAVEFKGKFNQGSFIIGKTDPKSKIMIDEKNVKITDKGFFVFGVSKDRKNDVQITVITEGKKNIIFKKVYKRKYKIQRIDGLPSKMVTPPKEVLERIKNDNKKIIKARAIESDLSFFTQNFIMPIENSIITGVYGSQRILNGKPRSPHYGLDFAGKEGTPIKAMADGIVTLAENDLYFTGGTLIFDHGHGISTLYMHLKDIKVSKNQKVKQGDIIGTLGRTGRATGPHLDIRLNWFDIKLDPMTILPK